MLVEPGPTICRLRLGTDLRKLREAESLRLEDVAARLDVTPSTLSRIETGKVPTRTSFLTVMLDLYRVDDPGRRMLMADMARRGQDKGWWADCDDLLAPGARRLLDLEAAACAVRSFDADIVPALAQTQDYATAVCAASSSELTASQVKRLARLQLRRQAMLATGTKLHLILDEAVLRRTIGSPSVMTAQLVHLLAVGAKASVEVQVLALAPARPVLSGSFTVLSFAGHADRDVGYVGAVQGQANRQERDADVRTMRKVFDKLSRAALAPPESANLISHLLTRARA